MDWTRIVSLALSVGIFAFVVWLIRERRLREKYALLWLGTSLFVILLTVSRRVLEVAALSVGIFYPPSLLFLVGVLFLLMVSIGQSVSLSRLSESNQKLAQEMALLKKELEERKKEAGSS
ncbi:MAG TPA: DUF2304 domain-containing protein [Geobacteraceae bacterium]|nr:DUF2304 domain-containing protein [Geobacteraceae bacterium]